MHGMLAAKCVSSGFLKTLLNILPYPNECILNTDIFSIIGCVEVDVKLTLSLNALVLIKKGLIFRRMKKNKEKLLPICHYRYSVG